MAQNHCIYRGPSRKSIYRLECPCEHYAALGLSLQSYKSPSGTSVPFSCFMSISCLTDSEPQMPSRAREAEKDPIAKGILGM